MKGWNGSIMKRYGNLYEKIFSMDNLIEAHKHASNGKGWYSEVKEVNKNPEEYLQILQGMLINQTYETSDYILFLRKDGIKLRVIYKLPYFPDRICQWAIMQVIEPILINNFTTDTYSAIPGRGIHQALEKMQKAIRYDKDGTTYCLKMDVKKFYPNIDHNVLKQKFRKIFKDKKLLWLLDEIIDSVPDNEGVPIGNYLSQYCGNFYLSEFDHWIKETTFEFNGKTYKIKYYFRYMDDICILSDSKEFLHYLAQQIIIFMSEELHLTIKNNWQVFPVDYRGIDYIGYVVFRDKTLLRKRTVQTMEKTLTTIRRRVESGFELTYHEYCSINSYAGWLKPCDSYGLETKYIEPLMPYVEDYYHKYLKNQEKEEKAKMKQFINAESRVKKPQSWSDDLHTYVLLSQEETVLQEGTEDKVEGYVSSYIQYTHDEFQDLITRGLREQTINQLDQSLEAVRSNKIAESKQLLEQYYQEHPLFSTIHNENGEFYAVTSDKQSYLMSMLALVDQAKVLGVEFQPTWNATGEQCEPWTETELRTLALEIAQFVYPAVSKQQAYEKQIKSLEIVEEIQSMVIDYDQTEETSETTE